MTFRFLLRGNAERISDSCRLAILGLFLGGFCLTLGAEAQVDGMGDAPSAKVQARINKLEEEREAESSKLAVVHLAMQDLYESLSKTYAEASSGQSAAVVDELERILDPAFRAAAQTAEKTRGNVKKTSGAFARELPNALRRLENEFLKTLVSLVKRAALKTSRDEAANLTDFSPRDFAIAVARQAFAGKVEFGDVWNDFVVPKSKLAKQYQEQRGVVQKLDERITVLKDPKMAFTIGAPKNMARIPGGSYTVESKYGFVKKRRKPKVIAFYIDLYEVTHEEYWKNYYLNLKEAADKEAALPRSQDGKAIWFQEPTSGEYQPLPDMMRWPVTGIDCVSALAYAKAQGKRLPTEVEWVAAAAGSPKDSWLYSWGRTYATGFCNDKKAGRGTPAPVDEFKAGRSHFGVYQCCGNVKEWLATTKKGKDFKDEVPRGKNVVIRGGSYLEQQTGVSLLWRWELPGSATRLEDLGFRCAQDILGAKRKTR
ncbi:MAG: SUMF1/EgtB/PvdO family nonheme iron enzyme [Planctomycetota bacterium]